MNIQVVSFHCILKNRLGKLISSTYNHDVMTWDESQKELLTGLAQGLHNLRKGDKRKITLSADQAYGFYDPEKVISCHRADIILQEPLRIGANVILNSPDNKRELYRVIQIAGELITLDGNHPLAGQDLVFEIEATAARDATPEEIASTRAPSRKAYVH